MPNEINREKLIELMKQKPSDTEAMRHELEQMLNEELDKPAEDIDAQLVDDLLSLLNTPAPTAEEKAATWEAIEESIAKSRKPDFKKILVRCAAAAAAVFVLFFVTVKSAEAFQWTFLLKLFGPVAETFGIYSASNPDYDQPSVPDAYTDAPTEYAQVDYTSLEDMPHELHDVRIVPAWMMDGYTFVQGSVYEDPDVTTATVAYMCEDDLVFLNVLIFMDEEPVSSYEFEQSFIETGHEQIAGQQVTIYTNGDSGIQSYSWICNNAHYNLVGDVSYEDVTEIIQGLLP